MDKQGYKEMVSELIEEKHILKEQLHNSKTKIVQLESFVADLKSDYLDMGGDEKHLEWTENQSKTITINKWEN
jgi:hypothetical protein